MEKELFSIKAQNSFINQQQKTFLNVTESQEAFQIEFTKLKENLDKIYSTLQDVVNDQLAKNLPESECKRYL